MSATNMLKNEDMNESIPASTYAGYYFPYRYRRNKTSEGAWLRSFKKEQNRRFKAFFCNYKTLEDVKSEVRLPKQLPQSRADEQIKERKVDGFFLLKHCHAEDPSEIFSININDQGFTCACSEDFILFDNVQCVSASENRLELEAFAQFSYLQELQLSLNGLTDLKVKYGDFSYMQYLDLSYNNLSGNCMKKLGLLPNLLTLNLNGNKITEIPTDFAKCFKLSDNERYMRFPRLRILKLDNNKLWHPETFVSLGSLPVLEHLHLEHNLLYYVPQLFNQDGKIILYEDLTHSSINSESSASDLNDSTQNLSGEENDITNEESSKKDPERDVVGDSLDTLMSGEDMDLLKEDIPTDVFSQTQLLNESDQSRSAVPVETSIETQDSPQMYNYQTKPVRFYGKTRPPFSHLLYLNLANNRFTDEESLLPIAAWPAIRILSIYGNPIVKKTQTKKMNLLRRIFAQKLGINVISQCPCGPSHYHTEIYQREHRMVNDNVQKLPKLTVDQILALESSKSSEEQSPDSDRSNDSLHKETAYSCSTDHYENKEMPASDQTEENSTQQNGQDMSQTTAPTFFMTQSCDELVPNINQQSPPKTKKYCIPPELLQRHYKEYEILFEIDEDEEEEYVNTVQPPRDIRSNVQALRYALNHQCTIVDHQTNTGCIKDRSSHQTKHLPLVKMPRLTYSEKVANVLKDVKENSVVKEMSLAEVFSNPTAHKQEVKEAKKLLRQVENCYHEKSEDIVPRKDES